MPLSKRKRKGGPRSAVEVSPMHRTAGGPKSYGQWVLTVISDFCIGQRRVGTDTSARESGRQERGQKSELLHCRLRRPNEDKYYLAVVTADAEVVVEHVLLAEPTQEVFVVRDDDQLEVLLLPFLDQAVGAHRDDDDDSATVSIAREVAHSLSKRSSQRINIVLVQIRRRLVERQNAAVRAERVGQGQSDDDAREHLLAGRAPATHVHLDRILDHADAVVVRLAVAVALWVRLDEDRVDVWVSVYESAICNALAVPLLDRQATHQCPGTSWTRGIGCAR